MITAHDIPGLLSYSFTFTLSHQTYLASIQMRQLGMHLLPLLLENTILQLDLLHAILLRIQIP